MTATPDRDLAKQLQALGRERGDTVKVADVTDLVHALLSSLTGDLSVGDLRLYREIEDLAHYIRHARSDIAALRPDDIPSHFIPSATDELDAIVSATEAATNQILDAAEQLENIAADLPPDAAGRIQDVTTQLFEACNFQDITGQRTTKIVKALKHIEDRIGSLVEAFGAHRDEVITTAASPTPMAETLPGGLPAPSEITSEEDLLNGPQLPGNAALQAAIDALFAS